MRAFFVLMLITFTVRAEDPPLAEQYLHSGALARGEHALILSLETNPKNDEIRFGLGILQFVRAVERFGQTLHEFGAKSEVTHVPFLRIPVPKNPKASTISYRAFGRALDLFAADLARAEATLSLVRDDRVKLKLRLAEIKLDLTGNGKPTDKLMDMLVKLNRGRFEFTDDNKDFLVCFDRGDVAWLRAYCHLISAAIDAYRAFDLESRFDERVKDVFPNVEAPRGAKSEEFKYAVADGSRLERCRKHLLAVCELNRETWKHIRAETDDDHEWLPNSKQKAAIGLSTDDKMIDDWLGMMEQLEGLLKGERLIFLNFTKQEADGLGFNLKKFLDDPPAVVHLHEKVIWGNGFGLKFLEPLGKKKEFDHNALLKTLPLFMNAYMAWFN